MTANANVLNLLEQEMVTSLGLPRATRIAFQIIRDGAGVELRVPEPGAGMLDCLPKNETQDIIRQGSTLGEAVDKVSRVYQAAEWGCRPTHDIGHYLLH